MKVLFVYQKSESLISQHVNMLTDGLRQSATIDTADTVSAIRKAVKEQEPDIIHCHGCPSVSATRAILSAVNKGVRLVLTLHGQMEPWATDTHHKAPAIYWHKKLIHRAYAVILLGRLELTNFQRLGWNRRTEEIHNAVTTNTISGQEMCTATFAVYQKVMDSNTLELMDEPTARMLKAIIKIGIMGDRRWTVVLPSEDVNWRHLFLYAEHEHMIGIMGDRRWTVVLPSEDVNWRHLFLYAEHEHIRNYVDYGINILGLTVPNIDTTRIAAYFPDNYETPKPIREKVGDYKGKETDYLLRIIHQIRQKPLLLHLIELTRELYRDTVDDDQLAEGLAEKKLTAFTRSLMQVLDEQTALDEGYMPLPPADNRLTQQIRRQLENHLNIED